MTHFAGPSWKAEDGTTLVGEVMAKADAPKPGAIQWLLLRVKSREGSGPLAKTTFIRRIDTVGGTPPAAGCDAGHAGKEARMRYSALYEFYAARGNRAAVGPGPGQRGEGRHLRRDL